jgi:carnitine O-acetyltransferase
MHEMLVAEDKANGRHSPSSDGDHAEPAFFSDIAWERLNNTILSTSNCGNPALRMFGFGPTSADGFGIGYIIKENSISICAASKHRQTSRYLDALSNYFLEVRQLIKQVSELRGEAKSQARPENQQRSTRRSGRKVAVATPAAEDEDGDAELDGMLGGYGYFDMESLTRDIQRQQLTRHMSREEVGGNAHRRQAVGKRLHLGEYAA